MATGLSESSIQKKFENITGAQDSIQSVSLWIIHHKSDSNQLVDIWLKVLKKVSISQKLLLFYLCNDVVQNSKRKQAGVFLEGFKSVLAEALKLVRDHAIKPKVLRILNIWEERNIYKPIFIQQLKSILDGNDASNAINTKTYTATAKTYTATAKTYTASKKVVKPDGETKDTKSKEKATPARKVNNSQLLAEFKPQTLLHKVTVFRKMELENELKQQQLSKVKFDESSVEGIKQLKDKSQGSEFTKNFEDAVSKLEATVNYLEQDVNDRGEVIDLAETSEVFYDEQYKEAKIVANAYRNFGTRINNMKKKLDDIKNKFPSTPSPIPSPIVDAPSPEPTPPQSDPNDYNDPLDMEIDSDEEKKRRKAKNDPRAEHIRKSQPVSNSSSPNKSLNSNVTVVNEESRKSESESTSPKVKNHKEKESEKSHHKSHSRLRSVVSIVTTSEKDKQKIQEAPKRSHSHSRRESMEVSEEEGCSTPVQDEATVEPPVQKENPIDFLTKLLSQTSSSGPTSGSSFLQNLSLLTSTVKSQYEQNKLTKDSPETSEEAVHESEEFDDPPSWDSWKTNEIAIEPTSPGIQIPTIQGYSPGATSVNHTMNLQPLHPNVAPQITSSTMPPRMVAPPVLQIPVTGHDSSTPVPSLLPINSALRPHEPPPSIPGMDPVAHHPLYPQHHGLLTQPGQHGPVLPPHMMQQHGHSHPPPPGMYQIQQHTGHMPVVPGIPGQPPLHNHSLPSPRSLNPSPEVLLPNPVVSRSGFNYNSAPNVMHQSVLPPPPPPEAFHQHQSLLGDDSGLDDILNQIVTGEGFQQTSPGEKENRPGEHLDSMMMDQMPPMSDELHPPFNTTSSFLTSPGKSILRKSNSVLQEVPLSTSQPSSSGAIVIPLGQSSNASSDGYPGFDDQPQFIQSLGSVERDPTEDIEDFTEKLNTGAERNNHGHAFSRNPIRPNLTCLTPQEDETVENIKSISTIGNHNSILGEFQPIMTLESSRRIPAVVNLVDAEQTPDEEPHIEDGAPEHSHSYGHNERVHNFDERRYEPPSMHPRFLPPRNPYYDRPRDPYARYPPERFERFPRDPFYRHRDPYGPPPPKRPFPPDGHPRRSFYRY